MTRSLQLIFLFTLLLIKNHFGQCDSTIIQGDFVVYNDTTLEGSYYVLGEFRIPAGVTVFVKPYEQGDCGNIKIYADKIVVEGQLNADYAGYVGGSGGSRGENVFSSTGHTGALTGCSGSGNPGQVEVESGFGGVSGNGPGGGENGKDGRTGSGPKQECSSSDDAGLIAGSSGGSGGGGASYGGLGEVGGYGGDGSSSYTKSNLSVSSAFAVNAGFGKSGGDPGVLYGTNSDYDIDLGSGGAGASGGGRSYAKGIDGESGGAGGGMIFLKAISDSLIITGTITVNGENGGNGGWGGDGGIGQNSSSGCCSDPCQDCGEKTFSCGAGGGGGAGGGSGGGILLFCEGVSYITGSFESIGGNGGYGASGGFGVSCSYNAPWGCGGDQSITTYNGSTGGSGGGAGGGRVKFFASDCIGNIILPTNVTVSGGMGTSSANPGHFHLSTNLICNVLTPPPPPPPTGINSLVNQNLEVFPNPVSSILTVNLSNINKQFLSGSTLYVYDLFGKVVYSALIDSATENKIFIDVNNFSTGTYILNLSSENINSKIKFLKI